MEYVRLIENGIQYSTYDRMLTYVFFKFASIKDHPRITISMSIPFERPPVFDASILFFFFHLLFIINVIKLHHFIYSLISKPFLN